MSHCGFRKLQLAVAGAVLGTLCAGQAADAAVVFSDNFSTSTLNSSSPAAPTATSTNYQVLSTKNATGSSIAPGSLQLNMTNTSSGFAEMQALFASSPVALSSSGDYVQLTMTFVPTGVNLFGNSTFNAGLYNSGGSGPVPGEQLNNGQLDDNPFSTPPAAHATGGAAGWQGYVSRIGVPTGATTQIFTRPAQVGETTNEAQDTLFNNAGTGAFDSPSGTGVVSSGTSVAFSPGTTYTFTTRITNNGAGLDVMYDLSDGSGSLSTLTGTDGAPATTAFDALAFGFRGTDGTGPYTIDVSSIAVESNVVIPEPASLALLGLGGLALLRRRAALK